MQPSVVASNKPRLVRPTTALLVLLTVLASLAIGVRPAGAASSDASDRLSPRVGLQARQPARKPAQVKLGHGRSSTTIEVKFAEGTDVRLRNGDFVSQTDRPIAELDAVLQHFPGTTAERQFTLAEQDLDRMTQRTEAVSGRDQADMNLYYRLRVTPKADIVALTNALNRLHIVETADLAPTRVTPPLTPSYVANQGYRTASANGGIDADYAQTLPGGKGQNVRIIDIENNWNRSHEDLSKLRAAGSDIRIGTPDNGDTHHGTAVIGEISGDSNAYGVTGLAPGAWVGTVNAWSAEYGTNNANAIATAAQYLRAGDVMLLELQIAGYAGGCASQNDQRGCVPAEWNDATYTAIVNATAAGIIVVEAAGNGSQNLDDPYYGTSFPHGRPDSGAIMVGAGNPKGCSSPYGTPTLGKMWFSNYGRRVDVQAWGACVSTTGYGDLWNASTNAQYTNTFGGTSSASPIVASAAAVLSSVAKQQGTALTPAQVRSILKSTGTPQAAGESTHIGPQPNLRAAISALGGTTASKAVVTSLNHFVPTNSTIGATVPVRWTWAASSPSGVTGYAAWVSTNGGAWQPVTLPTPTTTSITYSLTPGNTYAFAVTAKNGSGVWGDYKTDAKFTPRLFEENNQVSYSTATLGWTRSAWSEASGGYLSVASARSATAAFTFTAKNVAWVGTKATNRGQADIYVDGTYRGRVDMYAAANQPRKAAFSTNWPTSGQHTIQVVVVGTANRPKVDVDAFVIT